MSHTNHTQYYELPQYVGSDIINPLVDTNGAYETIDTAMHNIAAEAGQGTTDIAALQSKIGDGIFDTTAQNATDAVNEVIAELNTAETGVKARLTFAENDIDTLQSQLVTAQGNIVDLQNNKADKTYVDNEVAKIKKGGDIIIISASYGSVPSASDNCLVYLETLLGTSYDNIYTSTHGGDAFYDGSYLTQLQSVASGIVNKNDVKEIVVVGFGNDISASTEDSVITAMTSFMTYCATTFPNAKVSLAPVSTRGDFTAKGQLYSLYKKICADVTTHKISVMTDLYQLLAIDYINYLANDNIHPTSNGAKFIANGIYNVLVNGHFNPSSVKNNGSVSANTFDSRITPAYCTLNTLVNHNDIQIQITVGFTPTSDIVMPSRPALSEIFDIMDVPQIKAIPSGDLNYDNLRYIRGELFDLTDFTDIPVRAYVHYDATSQKYFISLTSLDNVNKTLTNGHNFRFTSFGNIPFELS